MSFVDVCMHVKTAKSGASEIVSHSKITNMDDAAVFMCLLLQAFIATKYILEAIVKSKQRKLFRLLHTTIPNLPRHVRSLSFGSVVCNLKFTCRNNNRGSNGGKLRRVSRFQIPFLNFSGRNLLIYPQLE